MMITVFTPTYNRANLLPRLYNSLLRQTNQNFEWLIVDDGSSDSTEEFINQCILENKLAIIYHLQVNKGKHYAINKGLSFAKGILFFILDSDDFLPADALELVINQYEKVKEDPSIAAVAGRRMYDSGEIVGSSNFDEIRSNSLDIRYKYNVTGDLVEVFRTDVLKQFQFPEIENEKFCAESLVWNRIAQKYNILFFNKGIYTTEYLPGGLTSNIVKIRMKSPLGAMFCYSELERYDIPFTQKIKANINFWRFSFNSNKGIREKIESVNIMNSVIGFPVGFFMYLNDLRKNK
ncbi:glycosyltransferase family 2 protein [Flavobacterium psychrolimnae]|uniref:Glycosyltransferase family 2 protein n=2 Tax=Flavobacterium psychrolimnae TaxID=249351 RepID=A0A366AZX1_9FLAO|nr:glycosyltransferase family 2 protein [Flavobacterium psychrolimnae]